MKSKTKSQKKSKNNSTVEERVKNLVEREFLDSPVVVRPLEQTRAYWMNPDGSATRYHELIGKFCSSSRILDICGTIRAGNDGTVEFKLTDFICLRGPAPGANFDRFTPPAFVVATARSDSPVYLTSQVRIHNNDILIKLFAWDSSGSPMPNTITDWRCCVQLVEIIG
jgi:hypothetical protein